jgi:photosystem II stability/assembly factor-like uncharacterized protein
MNPRVFGTQIIFAILVVLSVLINSHSATAQWIRQSPIPTEKRLLDVCFVNQDTGWVFGAQGSVFRTDDGGITWSDQSLQSNYDVMTGIFLDSVTGWISLSYAELGSSGSIYKSVNGGNNWILQYENENSAIVDLSFTDPDTGWALALCNRQYPAEIHKNFFLKTTDGGENWSLLDSIDQRWASRIQFLNDTLGYLTGMYDPPLMKSTDGGMTWQASPHTTSTQLTDVYFFDPMNGYSCGNNFYFTHDAGQNWDYTVSPDMKSVAAYDAYNGWAISYQKIYKFLDGGEELQVQKQINKSSLEDISVVDSSCAFVVGRNVCIYATKDGGQNWQEKSNGTHVDLFSVFFLDENYGWAGGNGGSSGGIIHRTEDGGEHWTSYTGSLPGYTIVDIQFVDPLKGWLANGQVHKTINGGQSWSQSLGNSGWVNDLYFVNDQLGWCTGEGGKVFKTINGGLNWNSLNTGIEKNLNAVFFANENTGWVAGEEIIMKTIDGGETWEESYVGYSEFIKIRFFDENIGYILAHGLYLKTYTGGEYWHTVNDYEIYGYAYFEDMCFSNPETGFLSGNSYLLKTTDGGETWQEEPEFPDFYSNAVYFSDEMNGWIVGNDGGIFHTTTGGTVGIDNPQNVSVNANLRIFPNPAKDMVQINFQTPDYISAVIEIYSLTGKKVFYKPMRDLPTVDHSLTWDPGYLPDGIYFCRISAGSAVVTGKIVLIK